MNWSEIIMEGLVNAIISAVAVIVAAIIGVMVSANKVKSQLSKEHSELESEHNDLKNEHKLISNQLTAEHDKLTAKINTIGKNTEFLKENQIRASEREKTLQQEGITLGNVIAHLEDLQIRINECVEENKELKYENKLLKKQLMQYEKTNCIDDDLEL